ncbi:uncharacterized protein VP01_265g8 [Puccinia sorghi]|uniref:Uncharacterized protein n=1 Tax=Puccinia sorghi TaxID=27349 RepID=A0A0L6V408_9BASI|nr:uncharacterized protein VP01_265g8 [Puccinia sorghi]
MDMKPIDQLSGMVLLSSLDGFNLSQASIHSEELGHNNLVVCTAFIPKRNDGLVICTAFIPKRNDGLVICAAFLQQSILQATHEKEIHRELDQLRHQLDLERAQIVRQRERVDTQSDIDRNHPGQLPGPPARLALSPTISPPAPRVADGRPEIKYLAHIDRQYPFYSKTPITILTCTIQQTTGAQETRCDRGFSEERWAIRSWSGAEASTDSKLQEMLKLAAITIGFIGFLNATSGFYPVIAPACQVVGSIFGGSVIRSLRFSIFSATCVTTSLLMAKEFSHILPALLKPNDTINGIPKNINRPWDGGSVADRAHAGSNRAWAIIVVKPRHGLGMVSDPSHHELRFKPRPSIWVVIALCSIKPQITYLDVFGQPRTGQQTMRISTHPPVVEDYSRPSCGDSFTRSHCRIELLRPIHIDLGQGPNGPSLGGVVIDPQRGVVMPVIRSEVADQQRRRRKNQARSTATAGGNCAPADPKIDPATFPAGLDPNLREAIFLKQDVGFISPLPPNLLAEVDAMRDRVHRRQHAIRSGQARDPLTGLPVDAVVDHPDFSHFVFKLFLRCSSCVPITKNNFQAVITTSYHLFLPQLYGWELPGNVPALVRLLRAFLSVGAPRLVAENRILAMLETDKFTCALLYTMMFIVTLGRPQLTPDLLINTIKAEKLGYVQLSKSPSLDANDAHRIISFYCSTSWKVTYFPTHPIKDSTVRGGVTTVPSDSHNIRLATQKTQSPDGSQGTSVQSSLAEEHGGDCVFAEGICWALGETCKVSLNLIDHQLHSCASAIVNATDLQVVQMSLLGLQNAPYQQPLLIHGYSSPLSISIIHHTTPQYFKPVLDFLAAKATERVASFKPVCLSSAPEKSTVAPETSLHCLTTVAGVRNGSRLSEPSALFIFISRSCARS